LSDDRPAGVAGARLGRRRLGKLARDLLLLFVILAMGLPFLVAGVGEVDLDARQEELVRQARRAAYEERSSLSNSLSHKVVRAETADAGLLIKERYYTFFGLPWGWSQATVSSEGEVVNLRTHLTLDALF
jgi:hypothetical protein